MKVNAWDFFRLITIIGLVLALILYGFFPTQLQDYVNALGFLIPLGSVGVIAFGYSVYNIIFLKKKIHAIFILYFLSGIALIVIAILSIYNKTFVNCYFAILFIPIIVYILLSNMENQNLFVNNQDLQTKNAALTNQNNQLKTQINNLNAKIQSFKTHIGTLTENVSILENEKCKDKDCLKFQIVSELSKYKKENKR
ncbi:MAG: hypothetical protein LBD21_09865 [Tannerellaceae bacterium]|jgi:hypothetical protein|nr:hypothetical protein [Tannerellaceae bacterium]